MQLFVRVFGGAIFAISVAVSSTTGAAAATVNPWATLVEYDQQLPGVNALNVLHLFVRSIPVRF